MGIGIDNQLLTARLAVKCLHTDKIRFDVIPYPILRFSSKSAIFVRKSYDKRDETLNEPIPTNNYRLITTRMSFTENRVEILNVYQTGFEHAFVYNNNYLF